MLLAKTVIPDPRLLVCREIDNGRTRVAGRVREKKKLWIVVCDDESGSLLGMSLIRYSNFD